MPMVDGDSISADDAMRRGLCPECGAPPTTADMARAHADDRWGGGRRGFLSAEDQRRRDLVLNFAATMRTTTRKVEKKGERPYQRQYPFQRIILASSPSVNWSDLCLPFRRGMRSTVAILSQRG
jgi:outer membrane scaffolding protein for murein synthesis (MipA/OmpV family)